MKETFEAVLIKITTSWLPGVGGANAEGCGKTVPLVRNGGGERDRCQVGVAERDTERNQSLLTLCSVNTRPTVTFF